jgi:hypothetical protein
MRFYRALVLLLVLGVPALAAEAPPGTHTRTGTPARPCPAALDDLAWLEGRWVGEALGGTVEEVWLPAAGGALVGVFRLVTDGEVSLYEILTLTEEEGCPVLRLKHFDAALHGWEAADETVDFPLVARERDAFFFDGMTVRRLGANEFQIWLAMGSAGQQVEREFRYRRTPLGR